MGENDAGHWTTLEDCKGALLKAKAEEKATIYEKMGDAYKALDKGSKALMCYQEAYDTGNEHIDFIEKYIHQLGDSGRTGEALGLLDKVLSKADDEPTRSRLLSLKAYVLRLMGKFEEGKKQGEIALRLVADLDRKDPGVMMARAEAHNIIGLCLWRLVRYEQAIPMFESAVEEYKEIDKGDGLSQAVNNIGIMHFLLGDLDTALDYYERSVSIKDRSPYYNNIGLIRMIRGDYGLAKDCFKTCIKKGQAEGYKIVVHMAQMNLGDMYLEMGNMVKAKTWISMAHSGFLEMDENPAFAYVLYVISRIAINEGDLKKAKEMTMRAMEIAAKNRSKDTEAMVLLTLALIARAEGDHLNAKLHLVNSLKMFKKMALLQNIGKVYMELAITNKALGNDEDAKACAEEARNILERLGSRPMLEQLEKNGL
jgi:tetratricopeptide (TPR) repeat protein